MTSVVKFYYILSVLLLPDSVTYRLGQLARNRSFVLIKAGHAYSKKVNGFTTRFCSGNLNQIVLSI